MKLFVALIALIFTSIAFTPNANAAGYTPKHWAGEHFTDIMYFCGTTVGTGKATGRDPSNCMPFADQTIYNVEAKTLIEHVYAVITTAITGTTDIDIGVTADDADGFLDGSLSLTLATPGVYGYNAKLAGAYLRVQTAGATDAADIYVVPAGKYYTAATAVAMDITTANTAGAMQVVIEGIKYK